jgi:uncharacterized protein YjbI with pentapeptide repeats
MFIKREGKSTGPKTSQRANAELPTSLETSQSLSFKSRLNASAKRKRPIRIKDRYLGRVLFETEAEILKDALEEAVALQVNLSCADLRNADLGGACLADAQLADADFSGANLFGAILWGATLISACFCNVDLRGANFRHAKLKKAVLQNSDLAGADFFQSDLHKVDFRGSKLGCVDLHRANLTDTYFDPRPKAPEEGSFVGWKRLFDIQGDLVIAKILIPEDAKRTTPLVGRRCRAEFVKILELYPNVPLARCRFFPDRMYYVDEIVRTTCYNSDVQVRDTHGLNFYLTREEAEQNVSWDRGPDGETYGLPLVPAAKYWEEGIYRGWVDRLKHINQPDSQEGKWRAGKLFDTRTAKLMNQWDKERLLDSSCSSHIK